MHGTTFVFEHEPLFSIIYLDLLNCLSHFDILICVLNSKLTKL